MSLRPALDTLAQKGYLMDSQTLTRVQTPQDFINTIRTNLDLQALVSGSGNINKGIPHNPTLHAPHNVANFEKLFLKAVVELEEED